MNKVTFIPGWMDTVKNRVEYDGLDIWLQKIDFREKIDSEYVVAHSAGANWAILNWDKNRNTKLILVMPATPKRNIFQWFWRWIKFSIFERTSFSRKRLPCFLHLIHGLNQIKMLIKLDLIPIVNKIPKENITIIKGKDDNYIFDTEAAEIIKSMGIAVIELDGVGHNWNRKITEEIERIIN